MKKISTLFLIACILVPVTASAWGKRNHSAIAYIAEQNLTPKAKAKVSELLDGRSIVTYASWLDYYRSTMLMESGETIPHIFQADADFVAVKGKNGCIDVVMDSIEKLSDYKSLDDSTRTQCLWNIIHLVGDLHCPGHILYEDGRDRRIGSFNINYRKKDLRMHTIWDSIVLEDTIDGGFMDVAHIANRFSKKEIKAIQAGTPWDWGSENAQLSKEIWLVETDAVVKSTYMYDNSAYALDMVARAGYRLAKVLNDLFK